MSFKILMLNQKFYFSPKISIFGTDFLFFDQSRNLIAAFTYFTVDSFCGTFGILGGPRLHGRYFGGIYSGFSEIPYYLKYRKFKNFHNRILKIWDDKKITWCKYDIDQYIKILWYSIAIFNLYFVNTDKICKKYFSANFFG